VTADSSPPPASPAPGLKAALDFGPLLIFFVANARWGLLAATAVLIPLSVVALVVSWRLEGRIPRIALFGTLAVVVFGSLTLILADETFIKLKLTILYSLFGLALGIGLLRKRSLLQDLLGSNLHLTEAGWRILTIRFTFFFFFLALLNEVLRRVLSTDAWVNFKVFGVTGASLVFLLLQAPVLEKHAPREPDEEPGG